jgi:hypothetical protein
VHVGVLKEALVCAVSDAVPFEGGGATTSVIVTFAMFGRFAAETAVPPGERSVPEDERKSKTTEFVTD